MPHIGWIAIVIFVVWRVAFEIIKRTRRSNERPAR
jgi:hypothetical protein